MENKDYENLLDLLNYGLNAESIIKEEKHVIAPIKRTEEVDPDSYNVDYDVSEWEMNNNLEEKVCEEIEADIKNELKGYKVDVSINVKNVNPSEYEDCSYDWECGEQRGTEEGGSWTMATFDLEIEVWVELQQRLPYTLKRINMLKLIVEFIKKYLGEYNLEELIAEEAKKEIRGRK